MSYKNITIGQIEELHTLLDKVKTIGGWKTIVKQFATENNLTDKEAIELANIKI